MTVFSEAILQNPHAYNFHNVDISGSFPKMIVSKHILMIPAHFGLTRINDQIAYFVSFNDIIFRIPIPVILSEKQAIIKFLKAQHESIASLDMIISLEHLKTDVDGILSQLTDLIVYGMDIRKEMDTPEASTYPIRTTTSLNLTLKHGTTLVSGNVSFKNAERGDHEWAIIYYDPTQDNCDPVGDFFVKDITQKNLRFCFTKIDTWSPSQECESAEYGYSFPLPKNLDAETTVDNLLKLMRSDFIDYLSTSWEEEFGDISDQDFAKIIFDLIQPNITYLNAMKSIYAK